MDTFLPFLRHLTFCLLVLTLFHCQDPAPASTTGFAAILADVEQLSGREAYLNSPFVAAGDRVYLVGHQNGQFPDLGWHVTGEMGGIWDHPIKLMDGFTADLEVGGQKTCLAAADSFINYPFANKHIYRAPVADLRVERMQLVPDGREAAVVNYSFFNEGDQPKDLNFTFSGYTDLRPVWLGERTGMEDGDDSLTWLSDAHAWLAQDSLNEWYTLFGADRAPTAHDTGGNSCAYQPIGLGKAASLTYALSIPAGGTAQLTFTIAGSYQSAEAAKSTYAEVQQQAPALLQAKKDRYAELAATSRLTVPADPEIEQVFRWLKYNTDWLIRDVPEIGRGLSAGLPDYPWWFGADNEYALQGVLAIGRPELVYSTIDLLRQISEKTNGNGRIIHEVSTNGAVFNPGNLNETPQFISLLWDVYRWTGNEQFLRDYYPLAKQGLDWLLRENDADDNLLPDGFGMMEIHGLDSEMVDVAVYTQQAFADAANMARTLGDTAQATLYTMAANQLRQTINTDFWAPDFNSYADFIGTTRQALRLIDDAIIRADTLGKPWAVEELKATRARIAGRPPQDKGAYVLHHNWVVNTPMEMGIADSAKAVAALETGRRFVNPFGLFVTGIDRDETAGSDESSFAAGKKVFSYTGAVMTLPTGVQAVAENNYGRPDQALDYLRRMTRSFSFALPGSMYEVSPDFGMMTQAWNIYSFAVPIVTQFFGIQPKAAEKLVRIQPQMPTDWPVASLENVLIGDNMISIDYAREGDELQLTITQTQADWRVEIALPADAYATWTLNGKSVQPRLEGKVVVVESSGEQLSLVLSR